MSPEELYSRLRKVVEEMPPIATAAITPEINRWLGQAAALVDEACDIADRSTFRVSAQNITGMRKYENAQAIVTILYTALAAAEMRAPASTQGQFIPAGNAFDAIGAFSSVLATAKVEVLVIDPYADANALTEFAILASEGISIRLLADATGYKPALKPAADGWQKQYGSKRPLEVRLSLPRALHDRLIQIDGTEVWNFGQSLRDFATRSPTSIGRIAPHIATEKIAAYAAIWAAASPI